MKRPLLKILPGVAVVLITPSCSKDIDIAEDNAALVAEQVTGNQVFYLKVNNASSLSKMTIEGLGQAGEKKLKFEKGDVLTLRFDIKQISYNSGYDGIEHIYTYTLEMKATCVDTDGKFEVSSNRNEWKWYSGNSSTYEKEYLLPSIENALEEMQNGIFDAASKYNVQLTWGNPIDFSDKKFYEYDDIQTMFAAAPRSANKSFTLQQNGDYCFVVFEEGCTKTVTVEGSSDPLDRSKCYIVKSGTNITVEGAFFNTITTESGNFYYVRKQAEAEAEDGSGNLEKPNPGNVQRVNL